MVLAAALATSACRGSDAAESEPDASTTTTSTGAAVALTAGEAVVASAGPDVVLDEPTKQALVATSQSYVDTAVLAPLLDGAVGAGYEALFDGAVAANATGVDRAALTDEGISPVTESPTVTSTPVRIDGLADGSGGVQLMATSFTLAVEGETAAGPLTIQRTTELTFAPGANGAWLITAYRVSVTRETAGDTTTTTAAAQS